MNNMQHINLYQYLAVIPPSRSVDSDVTNMKNWCMTTEGWKDPIRSKPHFTVCQFIQPLYNEEKITKKLQQLSETFDPFTIFLFNFGSFRNKTNTIYLCVENEKQFSKIPLYLRKHLTPLFISIRNHAPRFIKKGHLTIARNIPESEFNRTWSYWENMKYYGESPADRILLLRKRLTAENDLIPYARYERVGDYPFLGKSEAETQLELF